ncbi:MAG: GDYXXLXY domain-containing protein [Myxococcota bacterium]
MTRSLRLLCVALSCAGTLGLALSVVTTSERRLESGVRLHFRTAALDPVDPLRGRYVALRFEDEWLPRAGVEARVGGRVRAIVAEGPDGLAHLVALASPTADRAAPSSVDVEVAGVDPGGERVAVRLPLERYYMNEHEAPALEAALGRTGERAIVTARLEGGRLAIESVVPESAFRRATSPH